MAKKLHELLAVAGNLQTQSEKTRTELQNTFEKKRHHFAEKRVTFKSNDEGKPPVTEEQSDLQTTVGKELAWIKGIMSGAIDVAYQVAQANTVAKADIKLEDGTVLAENVPATALLELEKRLGEVFTLVSTIPTLDPAKGFELDTARGEGIYKAREENRARTKKTQEVLVLYPATKEHPAQTQLVPKDVVIGELQTQEWSGLLTTAQKGDMLDRVEAARRAVKSARSRANDQSVSTDQTIADSLLTYVFGK